MSSGEALASTTPEPRATSRVAARLAWSPAALAVALSIAGRLVALRGDAGSSEAYDGAWLAIVGTLAIVGALVASRQPRNPIGWILSGLAVFAGLASLLEASLDRVGETDASAWLGNWTWIPLVLVPLAFLPVYFPHGRLLSRRWRVVPWCAGIGTAGFAFSQAFAAGPLHDDPEVVNPYGIEHAAVEAAGLGSLLVVGAILAGVVSVVLRFRRASGVERDQIKWLAYAGCFAGSTFLAAIPLSFWSEDVANAVILLGVLSLPLGLGIAILRHRLYDIDLLINRTLVYGGLTVGVVTIYVAVVGGLSSVLHDRAGFWLALVATGLAALLVQPLRSRLQRRVNQFMYGSGEDGRVPAGGLRERLHEAFVPEAAELQRARERLVAAREEERRRLRRDLHDGLGPALAGAALKLEAAENLLASKPGEAAELLDHARAEIQAAVGDVRRLVYDLRPPALDELGLAGALRQEGERLATSFRSLRLDVHADDLADLPAAIEVAAYRISVEAMTNAARHAGAQTCTVRITDNGALELEITDDGRGLPDDYRAGVGIASMRERAEELGGTCEIERVDDRGTRVRASLPLAPP